MILLFLACTGSGSPGKDAQDSGDQDSRALDSPAHTGDTDTGLSPEAQLRAWEAEQGLDLVALPPGSFLMGSPDEEVGRWVPEELGGDGTDREVLHEVTLTHTTLVGRNEVTQALFETWMGYNPSELATCGADCPVDYITWHEAAAFANTLSAAAGLAACYTCEGAGSELRCDEAISPYACSGYRLPTEAEWEYAARAGEEAAFIGGGNLLDDTEEDCTPGLLLDDGSAIGDLLWYCGNAEDTTHPIGQFEANAWGLYDAQGNIHEWTHDWYQDDWYQDAAYLDSDPVGPVEGTEKVRRGGAWAHEPRRVRLAYRGWHEPEVPANQVGMRLFRSE